MIFPLTYKRIFDESKKMMLEGVDMRNVELIVLGILTRSIFIKKKERIIELMRENFCLLSH